MPETKIVTRLEDVPNVGKSVAADLRSLGIRAPADLKGRDPCVLDTFMAAVAYAETGDKRPWWAYTKKRKALNGDKFSRR